MISPATSLFKIKQKCIKCKTLHISTLCRSLRSLSRCSVEEEFPHLYAHGCSLRDICAECTKFVADVISSSRRSLDILNNTPKKEAKAAAVHQRPQLQCHSHLDAFSQPEPHLQCHPALQAKSQTHPPPQSYHQQQFITTKPSHPQQLHCNKIINHVNQ